MRKIVVEIGELRVVPKPVEQTLVTVLAAAVRDHHHEGGKFLGLAAQPVAQPRAERRPARLLRPGGRLVLTTWDYGSQPENRPPQVADHRPLLEAAGFGLLQYAETDSWRERQTRIDLLLLDAVDELAAEDGSDPDEVRQGLIEMHRTLDHMIRRVLIVAERL